MKRIQNILCLLVVTLLIPVLTASAQDFAKTFSVSPGGVLKLDMETGGSIEIVGWNRSEVDVKISVSGRDNEEVIVDLEELRNGVSISTEFARRNSRAEVEIVVSVPHVFDLDLLTMGGEISVTGVEGELVGETMGGEITLSDLKGDIDFETMGGEITLEESDVSGRVHTMGGEITVDNVAGSVSATTMGGEVSYSNARSSSRAGGNSEVRIETMGGEIDVDRADFGANLETMGGEIRVGSAKDHVVASTMGGEITIEEIDGWVEASTMGGEIEVHMVGNPNEGDRHVDLSSMGGDILLTVPAGLSMDIQAEITVSGRHDVDDYTIESDFDLMVERTGAADRGRNDDARIEARGSIGGGKNKIRVKTTNGDIRILRSR